MNANDVIESYVHDVAVLLPSKQRNDVAFELRALLHEGLQDRAEATGRSVDAATAIEFLQAFGRPADVAARYRPSLTIIDPANGHAFLRATFIGLAIISSAGLLERLQQPIDSGSAMLQAIGQWLVSTVNYSLWWAGLLVLSFGAASWARRRKPQRVTWQPRVNDRIHGSRAALALGLIGIVFGLSVLIEPRWLLDVLWGGRAAPAAYQALTYAGAFRQREAPWLFALIALNIPLLITVLVHGRWTALLRRFQTGLSVATCALMAWVVADGPVLMTPASDGLVKLLMVLIVAITLVDLGINLLRSVRPTPNHLRQA